MNLPSRPPQPFDPGELEEIPCTVCHADGPVVMQAGDPHFGWPGNFALHHCKNCDNTWLSPRPTESDIGRAYAHRPDFHLSHLTQGKEVFWEAQAGRVALLQGIAPPGGWVADFGSGDGLFMLAASRAGYQVLGFEYDEACRAIHQQEFGLTSLPVGPGKAGWWPLQNASVQAVTMWSTLEHVHHPGITLAEACRVLKPGGAVLICVPNFASLERRIFGKYWLNLALPLHLSHFSPRSLRRALEQSGFVVERLWCATTATAFTNSLRARWRIDLTATNTAGRSPGALFRKVWLKLLINPILKLLDNRGLGGTLLAIGRKPITG